MFYQIQYYCLSGAIWLSHPYLYSTKEEAFDAVFRLYTRVHPDNKHRVIKCEVLDD